MTTSGEHNLGIVLVTGGSGGLASQILELFSQRGCTHLHSIDLRQPRHHLDNVTYHEADLTDMAVIRLIFTKIKPDVVIHTASPKFDAKRDIMYKVNVEGTRTLLKIAKESRTRSFVYRRSASVINDGKTDLRDANETFPVITGDQQPEFYTHTKALTDTEVQPQNHAPNAPYFLICAIRPSGIFGVGDLVVISGILDAYYKGKTWVQLGSNKNPFDFTENTNVAHAHYLAAVALFKQHDEQSQPTPNEKIDGEAFFITNDEPHCFWDFTRLVWRYVGDTTCPEDIWTITRPWAFLIAVVLEWIFWALRLGEPPLTRTKVRLSYMTRYFCMDKAKTRLWYKPLVGLEEGLRVAVEDCVRRRQEKQNGTQKASRWVNGFMSWTRVSTPKNMKIDSSDGIKL